MSTTILTHIDTNIDLNALFSCQISYNFDLLKQVIEALLKNQKGFEQRLDDKEKKIEQLENEINDLKKLKEKVAEHDGKINKLDERVTIIEGKLNFTLNLAGDVEELKKKVKKHDERLDDHDEKIDDIYKKLKNIFDRLDKIESQIEEINKQIKSLNLKILDFNVYDSLKGGDGDMDKFLLLLQNLEKKVFLKFDNHEGRIENLEKEQKGMKENIETILTDIEELKKRLKNLGDLKDYIDQKYNDLLKRILNLNIGGGGGGGSLSAEDLLLLKDLEKRVQALELLGKLILEIDVTVKNQGTKIDTNRKDIDIIFEMLKKKANLEDFMNLKKQVEQINNHVVTISNNLHILTNEEKELEQEVKRLKLLIGEGGGGKGLDPNKYLEKSIFMEFKVEYNKEIENIYKRLDELRKLIDDILEALKKFATKDELRMLEEMLLARIEELKIACNKKFADKNDTAKHLRFLEMQIKKMTDLQKVEKADNWLLAKRPIGGNSCASCEAYIGDLHENNTYIPWNKYPMRDPNERLYRIGSGFSKMLQMLNVDQVNNFNNGIPDHQHFNQHNVPQRGKTSQGFRPSPHKEYYKDGEKESIHHSQSQGRQGGGLPQVKQKGKKIMDTNLSADEVSMMEQEHEHEEYIEDPYQPRIVKIYKKSKFT